MIRASAGTVWGAFFLQKLCEQLKDAGCVLLEVEDPEDGEETKQRRLNFYLRNGMVDTGVRSWVFGADYRILRMPMGDGDVEDVYTELYRSMLPMPVYKAMVRIKNGGSGA